MANSQSRKEPEGMPASPASGFPGPEPRQRPSPKTRELPGVGVLEPALRQLGDWLAKDPILRASEEALNANPLHDVIPIDWAEIARALRTVWLHQLSRPESAITAAAELNLRLFQSSCDIWTEAVQRWCGMAPSSADGGEPARGGDKRFMAPEWHHNPLYRTLKEAYLLASAWLLHQSAGIGDMDEAERQRLDFQLRQFVDAVSSDIGAAV